MSGARWWWDDAACAGMWDLFEDPERMLEAKAVCASCPVIAECRADGDATERSNQRAGIPQMVLAGEDRDERWRRRRGAREAARRTRIGQAMAGGLAV